jgi:metal-responsive CopG/Arc/MetJ family transcriptional regulator
MLPNLLIVPYREQSRVVGDRADDFGFSIDSQLGKKFDEHIKRKGYSTRSDIKKEFLRYHLHER